MKRRLSVTTLALLACGGGDPPTPLQTEVAAEALFTQASSFTKIFDPSLPDRRRYLNDHAFVRARDGSWHVFGIVGDANDRNETPDSSEEHAFAHASAPDLRGPWTAHPDVLEVDPEYFGEDHVWAPDIVSHEGTYYMFYAAGSGERAAINLATSTDLFTWTRHPDGPMFRDGWEARDPHVVRIGNAWVMYYCATSEPGGGNHLVAYRKSTDLVHWSERAIAFTDEGVQQTAPTTESPYVVRRGDTWYLFTGPRGGYVGTDVFRSDDPFHFDASRWAGHIASHAAEVIDDGNTTWVSHAGWFQRGLYLAELAWTQAPPSWPTASNPTAARRADGRLSLFGLSADRAHLVVSEQTTVDGPLSPFVNRGTFTGAVPSLASQADGRLQAFALDVHGTIHRSEERADDTRWSKWQPFFEGAGAAPVLAKAADGRLHAFVLERAGAGIAHVAQSEPNGAWSAPASFSGPMGGPPTTAVHRDGRIDVFALDTWRSHAWHRAELSPGGPFGAWESFGESAIAPVIGEEHDGRLHAFVILPYGLAIMDRVEDEAGGWSPWQPFGPAADGAPAVIARRDGRLEVLAVAAGGGHLMHRVQRAPGGPWGRWKRFGGPSLCAPTATRTEDGRARVIMQSPDGALWQRIERADGLEWEAWTRASDPIASFSCVHPT